MTVLAVCMGLLMILVAAVSYAKLNSCTTEIQARVVDYVDRGDSDGREFRPAVEYTHNGKTLCCPVRVDGGGVKYWDLEEVKREFPEGKKVTVYIDPKKPEFCTLNPDKEKNENIWYFVLGIILILLLAKS